MAFNPRQRANRWPTLGHKLSSSMAGSEREIGEKRGKFWGGGELTAVESDAKRMNRGIDDSRDGGGDGRCVRRPEDGALSAARRCHGNGAVARAGQSVWLGVSELVRSPACLPMRSLKSNQTGRSGGARGMGGKWNGPGCLPTGKSACVPRLATCVRHFQASTEFQYFRTARPC